MGQIDACDAVWVDILAWIDRGEVGMKFALVNSHFNALVDKHFKQRKWHFGELHICKRGTKKMAAEIMTSHDGSNFDTFPLPTTPLPNSVIGFRTLSIWYIDKEVVNFLRKIRRLFAEDIALEFSTRFTEYLSWQAMARHIWPLLQDGISTLVCLRECDLAMLRKHVSPTVLFDCPNLHAIHTKMVPECPTTDAGEQEPCAAGATCRDLYTWIQSPREDEQPRILRMTKWKEEKWDRFVKGLAMSFQVAPIPINLVVHSMLPFSFSQMSQIANFETQERLSMTTYMTKVKDGGIQTHVLIIRSPLTADEVQLHAWLNSSRILLGQVPDKLVHIGFNDDEIGQFSDADAEPMSRSRSLSY